jgi:hypothetical protein
MKTYNTFTIVSRRKHHCIGLTGEADVEIPVQNGLCGAKEHEFTFFGAPRHLLGEGMASLVDAFGL